MFNTASELFMRGPFIFDVRAQGDCGDWPKASTEWPFIWEAVDLVGAAMFGSEWGKADFFAREWKDSPLAETVQRYSASLLAGNLEAVPREADPYQQIAFDKNQARFNRVQRVIAWLADKARDGLIETNSQVVGTGGKLEQLPAYEWNRPNNVVRQYFSLGYYPRQQTVVETDSYIFFKASDLERELLTIPEALFAGSNFQSLPELLRLAVETATKCGFIDGEKPLLKKQLPAAIQINWKASGNAPPLSNRMLDAIADLVFYQH